MQEFTKYATMHMGINGNTLGRYTSAVGKSALSPMASLTPYIIEERPLHASLLDVFSRLMMDRIIFLGTEIDDDAANIV